MDIFRLILQPQEDVLSNAIGEQNHFTDKPTTQSHLKEL